MSTADTRERILATARRLFHAHGFNDVGINDVCREAKVVKGSLYHFFRTKQALLEAVVEANDLELRDRLTQIEHASTTGRDWLLGQLHGVVAEARRQKKDGVILGCNLGNLANELAVGNDGARRVSRRAFRAWLKTLERGVRKGIDDRSLPPNLDPQDTAVALLAVIQGMSTLARTFGDPKQLGDIVRLAEETLIPAT